MMQTVTRETMQSFRAVAKASENICALPAVATQDWCDRAAQAVLAIAQPAVAVTMIAQVDERGVVVRQEATGVAGVYVADVTTNVGRQAASASSLIAIDPNDANLAQVRTALAQARDLGWQPSGLSGSSKAAPAERFGVNILDAGNSVVKRWSAYRLQGLLLAAVSIGPSGRMLTIELGSSNVALGESEAAALEAVLPLLAKRATLALGTDASEASHWLTSKEQMILQHLLLGKSVREIAEELGRSPHTVHDHVKSLHRKLNASSRGELVAKALGYTELKPAQFEDGEPAGEDGPTPTIHVRPAGRSSEPKA